MRWVLVLLLAWSATSCTLGGPWHDLDVGDADAVDPCASCNPCIPGSCKGCHPDDAGSDTKYCPD